MRRASTVAEATIAFQDSYERCGTCHQATRISYALGYYNRYGGSSAPVATQVFETPSSTGWRPLGVGHNGQPLLGTTVSAVYRADGTRIVYTVRDGRLWEAASNAGWRNLQVPNHDNVTAVSAIAYNGAVLVYTVRGGAVHEAVSTGWQPLLVGYNGQPVLANTVSAILRADGTRIVYTVRDGHVHEAASDSGWRNLRVPNLTGVNTVSAINANGTKILYTR